jgi:hypothetical protein
MKKKLPTKRKTSNGIYEYNVFDNLWGSKRAPSNYEFAVVSYEGGSDEPTVFAMESTMDAAEKRKTYWTKQSFINYNIEIVPIEDITQI